MNKRLRSRVLAAAVCLCTGSGLAGAQIVVSAEWHPDENYPMAMSFGKTGSRTSAGQSFLALQSGFLHQIELSLYCQPDLEHPLDASVQEIVDGMPDRMVATTSSDPSVFPNGGAAMVPFDFSAANARIQAGTTYAILVTPQTLALPADFYPHALAGIWNEADNPYPDGHAFDSFNEGARWWAVTPADAHFRVTVDQSKVKTEVSSMARIKSLFR